MCCKIKFPMILLLFAFAASLLNAAPYWTKDKTNLSTSVEWKDVFFVNKTTGWIVGTGGAIGHTTNGGYTWQSQSSGITDNLESVFFYSSTVGWAVGRGGHTVLRTSNGGSTWTEVSRFTGINQRRNAYSCYFSSSSTGFMVGTPIDSDTATACCFKTTNGGASWSVNGLNLYTGSYLNKIKDFYTKLTFPSTYVYNDIFTVGSMGYVYFTTNSGTSWTKITDVPASYNFKDVYSYVTYDMLDALYMRVFWIVGSNGKIYRNERTTLGMSSSWEDHSSGSSYWNGIGKTYNGIYVVGDNGKIRNYSGSTWTNVSSPTTEDLNSVHFPDKYTGWAVGSGGIVVRYVGNIITNNFSAGTYCPGEEIDVTYSLYGMWWDNNKFILQLSDKDGDFANAVNLDTISGTSAGTFSNVKIPMDTPEGTGYRLRVISTSRDVTGDDNGSDITILAKPSPSITNNSEDFTVCKNDILVYKCNTKAGMTYNWQVDKGNITGYNEDYEVEIEWTETGTGSITLIQTNSNNCSDTLIQEITINALPYPEVIETDYVGLDHACPNMLVRYTLMDSQESNLWIIDGGTIVGRDNADTVWVVWNEQASGKVNLVQTNENGCTDTATRTIIIYEPPDPIIKNSSSDLNVCLWDVVTYSCNEDSDLTYLWEAEGGEIIGANDESEVEIEWTESGKGLLMLIQENSNGCIDTLKQEITINKAPEARINGAKFACQNNIETYSTTEDNSYDYRWYALNGKIQNSSASSSVEVLWDTEGTGNIKLIITGNEGCSDTNSIDVDVNKAPTAKITGNTSVMVNDIEIYTSNADDGTFSLWELIPSEYGKIIGNNYSKEFKVQWLKTGDAKITLIQNVETTDCKDTVTADITISDVPLPDPPTLMYPGNLSTDIGLDESFAWYSNDEATRYKIQIAEKGNFSTVYKEDVTAADTTYGLLKAGLVRGATYYWRVSSGNASGFGNWSDIWQFTTKEADKSITVKSPQTDVVWTIDESYNIDWSAENVDAVNIYYSTDNGGTWIPIAASYPDNSSYYWTVPNTPSAKCLIKITDYENESVFGLSGVFEIAEYVPASLTLKAPNGGEEFYQGSTTDIEWEYNKVDTIKIEFSSDNGGSWKSIEKAYPADPAKYEWAIPNDTTSEKCKIRISDINDVSVYDENDDVFSIKELPDSTIKLNKPKQGEILYSGDEYDIIWGSNNVERIILQFTSDFTSNSWINIDTVNAAYNYYKWIVPKLSSDKCRIRLIDVANSDISDTSGIFTILRIKAPKLSWPIDGSTDMDNDFTFNWESVNNAARYKIEISTDNEFTSLADASQDSNTYYQSSELKLSTTYYWRVAAGDSEEYGDWSDVWKFSTKDPTNSVTLALRELKADIKNFRYSNLKVSVFADEVSLEENFLPDSLYLTVKFKKNFLYPLVDFTDEDGWRYVTLEKKVSSITQGDAIMSFEAKVLLADTVYTPLVIDKYTWAGQYSDVNTTLTDGSLTLVNLGRDNSGNLRLIKPVEKAIIQNIRPNPADDKIILTIESNDDINAELEIYSSVGNILETKIIKLNKGANEITLPIGAELTNGIYSVLLRYNNGVDLRNLLIVR